MRLPLGPLWWGGFAIGGALLMLVMVAEYIVVDSSDARQPLASAGLIATSFALFLTLTVALRFAELRLFFILPALSLAGGLVCLRTLHLRKRKTWMIFPALVVTILLAQLIATLHYWPLSPITYGLVLLAPTYAITSLIISLQEGEPIRRAIVEPIIILLLVLGAAFWVR
jgi:hypothetical protein